MEREPTSELHLMADEDDAPELPQQRKRRETEKTADRERNADPRQYPILQHLDPILLASVRLFHVFDKGRTVLFVTRGYDRNESIPSESVYYLTFNETMCTALIPKLVQGLSGKRIQRLTCSGGGGALLLTEECEVYMINFSTAAQLVNFGLCATDTEKGNEHIIEVACAAPSAGINLALTSHGRLFCWKGIAKANRVGTVQSLVCLTTHLRITITSVSCGDSHSLALTDTGAVYAWGGNDYGQLGIGNTEAQCQMRFVQALNDKRIVQLVCGSTHSMALTHDGYIFTWGDNRTGQLGNGTGANTITPCCICMTEIQFTEIAASPHSGVSAAVSFKGEVYIWGQTNFAITYKTPTKTFLPSIHDAFLPVTMRPRKMNDGDKPTVSESVTAMYNDSETSDIEIEVEGKFLYAHKTILQLRSSYFQTMFRSKWKETETAEIKVTAFTYEVYDAFLRYLYTDKLDITAETAMSLVELSHSYCETQLKELCEGIIRKDIDSNNVLTLFKFASKFDCEKLKEYCLLYSARHMAEMVLSDSLDGLDIHMKMLIRDYFTKQPKLNVC